MSVRFGFSWVRERWAAQRVSGRWHRDVELLQVVHTRMLPPAGPWASASRRRVVMALIVRTTAGASTPGFVQPGSTPQIHH